MTRRSSGTPIRASRTQRVTKPRAKKVSAPGSRADRLVEMMDQLTLAKRSADELGERFLSYLISMTIQETRTAMRGKLPTFDEKDTEA